MSIAVLKTKPAARVSRKLPASTCPAEALLREWASVIRKTGKGEAANAKSRDARQIIEDRLSQVVAKSNVGAAFQLLVASTAWPWRQEDTGDPLGIADEAMDSITDGTDFKRRLMLGAYFHIARDVGDVDLRDAERWMTGENIDGGGLLQWLRDCQSDITFRELV